MRKLDRETARRVVAKLREIEGLDDPRSMGKGGKGLTGQLAGLWRYRVGDYRIICDIEGDVLVVLVLDVAHRSEAYRRQGGR